MKTSLSARGTENRELNAQVFHIKDLKTLLKYIYLNVFRASLEINVAHTLTVIHPVFQHFFFFFFFTLGLKIKCEPLMNNHGGLFWWRCSDLNLFQITVEDNDLPLKFLLEAVGKIGKSVFISVGISSCNCNV